MPLLPTSPAGPTHDGQPSRQGQAAIERAALGEQPVVEPVERLGEPDAARVVVVDEDVRLVVVARRRLVRAPGRARPEPQQPPLDPRLALAVVAEGDAEVVAVAHQEERRQLAERVGERHDAVAPLLEAVGQRAASARAGR